MGERNESKKKTKIFFSVRGKKAYTRRHNINADRTWWCTQHFNDRYLNFSVTRRSNVSRRIKLHVNKNRFLGKIALSFIINSTIIKHPNIQSIISLLLFTYTTNEKNLQISYENFKSLVEIYALIERRKKRRFNHFVFFLLNI